MDPALAWSYLLPPWKLASHVVPSNQESDPFVKPVVQSWRRVVSRQTKAGAARKLI